MENVRQFKGSIRGRDKKYDFTILNEKNYMEILPIGNIKKFRHQVSAAIYEWKKYNGYDWITPVRIENDKIIIYRVK